MAIESYQEKILAQLIEQESLLSKLYGLFARQFPEQGEFWTKLSREEERHARLIEKLRDAAQKGTVHFDEGKIKTYTLTAFIGQLYKVVEKAERGEFTLSSAFAYAVDYESALIEKNVFTRFDSLHEKIKGTLGILQSETLKHVDRIRAAQKSSSRSTA